MHNLRYRRALTAHPIDIVLYSGIIKRILQTVKFAVSFFAAVSRLKFAVLTVGDLRRLRYRRALTAHPIDVYTDLFFIQNIKRSER